MGVQVRNSAAGNDDRALSDALTELGAYINRELAPLTELAEMLTQVIMAAETLPIDVAVLDEVVPAIRSKLAGEDDLVGLGYSADHAVLRDNDNYLLWYQKMHGVEGSRRLVLNLDGADPEFYDYRDTEWFAGAREHGGPSIYGPYLDCAGANRLVYTFAIPVIVNGRFVGVAGADLDAAVIERRVDAVISTLGRPAVVVTRDRVVIAENATQWMPGERFPAASAGSNEWASAGLIAEWTGWRLAVLADL